jgi:tetratricopeptide (TPR) repeat protein
MIRNVLYLFVLYIFLSVPHLLVAQHSEFYSEPELSYKKAFELFNQKAYGASEKMFGKLITEHGSDKNNMFVEDAYFYSLVCAVEIKEGDALAKAEEFVKMYPESAHLSSAYFLMGKLYFDKRKYRQTLQVFDKINPEKLSKEQKDEYNYKKGYSYLKTNKPDQAMEFLGRVIDHEGPYQSPAKYYYAHILYLKKDYDGALSLFEDLKDNRRFKKYISDYLIHIYYEKKQYDKVVAEGEEYFKRAKSRSKGEIAKLLGNSFYELKNYDKALEYYRLYERFGRKITPEDNYKIGVVKYKAGLFKEAIDNFEQATRLKNEIGQTAWYYLGFCYLNNGQDKFARDSFLKAYRMGGNDEITTDALFNYEKATIKTGGDPYNDEIKIMEEFINAHKNSPRINEAYDLLVQLFITSKNYRQALSSLDKITSLNPRLKEIYQTLAFNNATELYRRSDFKTANEFFDKALKYPANPEIYTLALYWKAETLYRMHRYAEAERWYKQFLKRKYAAQTKYYPVALYNLGYTAFHQKKYDEAIGYFSKFLKFDNTEQKMINDALLRIADCYFIKKDFNKAITYYDKVINKGGNESDYALYQKASCYGAQGNFNEKINVLNTLVNRYRKSPLYTEALYEIGSTYLTINDQRHAISSFDKIVREKPHSTYAKKALMKTGLLYYGNNQTNQAVKVFKQVIKKYPASVEATEALNALKNIYTETGKIDEYIAYAKKLDFVQVSTSEEDSLTFVSGESFYISGNCDEAINALSKYVSKFPKGGFIIKSYYYLADCYARKDDLNSALVYFKKILEFPDNEYTLKALLSEARIEFDNKDFENSYQHYSRLNEIAESKSVILEALDGMMRSAFYTGEMKKAADAARMLLKTEKVSEDQIVFAHYVLAKTAYEKGNMKEALKEFSITDKLTSGEWGAESKYRLAEIAFKDKNYDKAEKEIYSLSDNYPEYPYWVAKGFILLSDIYLLRGNAFQAKQTLKSIIDNYEGEDLKQVAREKLEKIKDEGSNNEDGKEGENE